MAKENKKTEEVAASTTDAAATPVANVQEPTADAKETEASETVETENVKNAKGYGFTADAPKRIRYNGEVYSQEEILNNAELMHELVTGKCVFIKRV